MKANVAIIGAGIVGLTLARELARAGVPRTVVLDAGEPGQQSTGRSTGGIRQQFGNALEIQLTQAALKFYDGMFSDTDFDGRFERDGYVFLAGADERDQLFEAWQLQEANGVRTDWLDRDALASAYPFIDLAGVSAATRCLDDGFIDPWSIVQWLVRECRRLDIIVLSQHRVHAIEVAQHRVRAVTAGAECVRAEFVVNAAGAWAGAVGELAGVSVPVVPSPRLQIVTEPQRLLPPSTPLIADLSSGAYVRAIGDRVLAGVSPTTSPAGFEMPPPVESEEIGRIITLVTTRFPGLWDIAVARTNRGLYEMTPDGLPIAGGAESVSGFYTVAGFNGHGIMHSPPLACAIADVIVHGRTDRFDLRPFAPERFSAGESLRRRQSSLI